MKIFIICSVRGMDDEYKRQLEMYAELLEQEGHAVHLPHRDTNQKGTSTEICDQNRKAIADAECIHVFYSSDSLGTHFDLGVAWALRKPLVVVVNEEYDEGKSFARLIDEWQAATKLKIMTKRELVKYHSERLRQRILTKPVPGEIPDEPEDILDGNRAVPEYEPDMPLIEDRGHD